MLFAEIRIILPKKLTINFHFVTFGNDSGCKYNKM